MIQWFLCRYYIKTVVNSILVREIKSFHKPFFVNYEIYKIFLEISTPWLFQRKTDGILWKNYIHFKKIVISSIVFRVDSKTSTLRNVDFVKCDLFLKLTTLMQNVAFFYEKNQKELSTIILWCVEWRQFS